MVEIGWVLDQVFLILLNHICNHFLISHVFLGKVRHCINIFIFFPSRYVDQLQDCSLFFNTLWPRFDTYVDMSAIELVITASLNNFFFFDISYKHWAQTVIEKQKSTCLKIWVRFYLTINKCFKTLQLTINFIVIVKPININSFNPIC